MLERCLPSRRSGDYALLALLFTLLPGAPALAGPYTDAGHPVSSMGAWATAVDELVRGPQDIAVPGSPPASAGLEATVLGAATGDPADTVSLGDGGSITVFLADAIHNGPGDDFAVYDLQADPEEARPIQEHSDAIHDARSAWQARFPPGELGEANVQLHPQTVEALRSLGYLDEEPKP